MGRGDYRSIVLAAMINIHGLTRSLTFGEGKSLEAGSFYLCPYIAWLGLLRGNKQKQGLIVGTLIFYSSNNHVRTVQFTPETGGNSNLKRVYAQKDNTRETVRF